MICLVAFKEFHLLLHGEWSIESQDVSTLVRNLVQKFWRGDDGAGYRPWTWLRGWQDYGSVSELELKECRKICLGSEMGKHG